MELIYAAGGKDIQSLLRINAVAMQAPFCAFPVQACPGPLSTIKRRPEIAKEQDPRLSSFS